MATYYFDFQGGNGAGTSPSDSRNTFLVPGDNDVLRFKRGSSWTRATQAGFGTAVSLVIEAYANGDGSDNPALPKPIITNTQSAAVNTWNFQGNGVHTIRNLQFINSNSALNGAMIGAGAVAADAGKFASLLIEDCDFFNIAENAIRSSGIDATASRSITIRRCTFDTLGEDAFYGCADKFEFSYNNVRNVSAFTVSGDGVGFIGCNPTLAWIHHNYIDHSTRPFKHCIIIDTTTAGAGFSIIEDNVLIGSVGNGSDNTTIVNMESAGIIRRNFVYSGRVAANLSGAGGWFTNNVVKTLQTVGDAPVIAMVALNCVVSSNTIVGDNTNTTPLVASGSSQTGQIITNNIAINAGTFYARGGGATETLSNNAFENVTVKYTAGTSSNDIDTILNLHSDYSLKADSAVRGLALHQGYTTDVSGTAYNNPPSIGAYEYIEQRGVRF